jgi:hypothetical protein
MSTRVFTETYHCANECTSRGCPGHPITVRFHYTSETVVIEHFGDRVILDRVAWDTLRRIAHLEHP